MFIFRTIGVVSYFLWKERLDTKNINNFHVEQETSINKDKMTWLGHNQWHFIKITQGLMDIKYIEHLDHNSQLIS